MDDPYEKIRNSNVNVNALTAILCIIKFGQGCQPIRQGEYGADPCSVAKTDWISSGQM